MSTGTDYQCSDDENGVSPGGENVECNELAPRVGMKFLSDEEAFEFYKAYSYKAGFPVKRRNSKKGDDGKLRYVTFACCREGKRISTASSSVKQKPTIQLGCKAKITATADMLGMWRITGVHLEHNHEISPSKSRLYRCNRQLKEEVKRKLEVNDVAGIPLHKSYNSVVVEEGGYENLTFIEKDCRNYIDKVRRLRLGEGDAAAIQAYFSKMQSQCPGFYFNVDLDNEFRLKNVFWADNRCRQAYKEFGDVVTFDTTYLTNKYDMPFAPFVGVNHHGHSTLLGCGLLSNEDTDTFVWLFQTWLECMDGQAPIGIITDQDRAMQNAIQIVFPDTKHRWCLWHILKKLPEKFGYHSLKGSILSTVHDVVYESQVPQEFEQGWNAMIDTYALQDNTWLLGLYIERHRWVPCYLRTSFWSGMSTTQRSESMNAFFDGYVNSKTSLKQFVEQYERALRSKVEKEFQADFRSYSAMIPCLTNYGLEKQMQQVYTIAKFKEVQTELIGMMFCDVLSWEDEFAGTRYVVREDVVVNESTKRKKFTVVYVKDQCQIVCSCHLFEFRGILCKHAFSVLIREEVKLLPDRYILRRWRRDVQRAYTRVKINYFGWVSTPAQVRYDQLFKTFGKVANLVVDDDVRTKELMEFLENHLNELVISKPSMTCQDSNFLTQNSVQLASDSREVEITQMVPILDPTCKKTKGAPRKNRKKGPLEKNTKKTKVISKLSKGKRPSQNNENDRHGTIEQSTYVNSHMLMGSQFQHWEGALGMPTYALQWQLQDEEAVGLNSIHRN